MESGIGHRSDRTVGNMINVGLIGFGVSGKGIHLPLIRQVDDYNLLGVVSRSLSADDAEREGLLVYSTVDDMILNSNIDLIVITSPSNCHYEHARLCLSSGKHVVVEKPFCSSTLEAAALIQIALDEGLMLNVFHNRRYDVDYCSVKRVISSGVLGGISHFSSSYHRYRPNVGEKWKERPMLASGALYDIGPHLIDQMYDLFGIPNAVYADIDKCRKGARVDDFFYIIFYYDQCKVYLNFDSSRVYTESRFVVNGAKGSVIVVGQDDQDVRLSAPGLAAQNENIMQGLAIFLYCDSNERKVVELVTAEWREYYVDLAALLNNRGLEFSNAFCGYLSIYLIEVAKKAACERKLQYVDKQKLADIKHLCASVFMP